MDDGAPIDPTVLADWDDVLPGWTPQLVPLDWLPDLAPTYRTRYAGDDRHVDVLAVTRDLPDADVLPMLLVDARPVTVRGEAGWIWSLPSGSTDGSSGRRHRGSSAGDRATRWCRWSTSCGWPSSAAIPTPTLWPNATSWAWRTASNGGTPAVRAAA